MANVATNSIAATYSGANLNEIFYEPVFEVMILCVTIELFLM